MQHLTAPLRETKLVRGATSSDARATRFEHRIRLDSSRCPRTIATGQHLAPS